MKSLKLALVAAAAAAVLAPAQAQGISYNIGVVSLYKSNGVDEGTHETKKSSRPALQGGADYDFGNGFYVGNWNSTGKFEKADVEIDLYAGYANELANGLSYDLGVARYIYPGARAAGWNTNEAYISFGYGIATLKATRGLSDANKKASRYSITLAQPVNEQLTAILVYGDRNRKGGNFSDFAVGADYDLGDGMTASALVSGAGKVDGVKDPANKTRLVLGLSKSF